MAANHPVPSRGFVLESADSVRFGPEYTPSEVERNRQVLFGELLCGLLMGESIWTNAIFAFDSAGMVEVLGAVSRAFLRTPDREQFLPFIVSVYPGDHDPWTGQSRLWQNPAELFLRCYAHRLANCGGFQLSATPKLESDADRRTRLANSLRQMAETGNTSIPAGVVPDEQRHFANILSIDQYLRSWLGARQSADFQAYCEHVSADMPIRKNLEGWQHRYESLPDSSPGAIARLRFFLEQAAHIGERWEPGGSSFAEGRRTLQEVLGLPDDHACFKNRTAFRSHLKQIGLTVDSDTFRLLIELADGHYIRTQYTELTHTAREVTSPASKSEASQIGETWAAQTMQACLKSADAIRPWQFINRIQAVPSKTPVELDLDQIAAAFADYVAHPDRRAELNQYHALLRWARSEQSSGREAGDEVRRSFGALLDHVSICIKNINQHMAGTGTEFHFNVNDQQTCAGSLTLTFLENRSTSQCTGSREASAIDPEPLPKGAEQSEGSNNCLSGTGK
ncbi:MAG: hypothetical protein J5I93_05170 [Pirellulaceae bacterium]|nr:hypothetical protein [Pirellulaceae bacterium]